jgi:hypothetical protein
MIPWTPPPTKCECGCGRDLEQKAVGRIRRYATDACRKRAQRDRDWFRRLDTARRQDESRNAGDGV